MKEEGPEENNIAKYILDDWVDLAQTYDNPSLSSSIDSLNEPAELSEIETGGKGADFDEMISFSHTYLNYRVAKCFSSREQLNEETFRLLMTNVFIYSGDVFDIKSMVNMTNSEAVKNVRKKIKDYKRDKRDDMKIKTTFIENLPFYAKTIGLQETSESILPIITDLPKEKDELIERFFRNFSKFVDEIVAFGDKGYFILKEHMINLLSEILSKNNDVNILGLASNGLLYMTKFIKEDDKAGTVLTLVIGMAQENDNPIRKEKAMYLFGSLASLVSTELIQSYAISQVNLFQNDESPKVRLEVAKQLINISEKIPNDLFIKKILPVYKNLSGDKNNAIKKECVLILPKITKLCNDENLSKELIQIYKNFVNDENSEKNNSKYAAIEIFGEFISFIKPNENENFDDLLKCYVESIKDMSEEKREYKTVIEKCAYNFPAVLQFFGAKAWPQLKPCFERMANQKDEKIKMKLACALGEISKLLGSEITESDLLEYVDKFFKSSSPNSELKIKILTVLPDIIKLIQSNRKNAFLEYIKYMIGHKGDNWRKRLIFCKIIAKFNGTYSDPITYKRVFPIAINFCFDDVSHIRSVSARKNSRLILQLISSSETNFKEKAMKIVTSFARSINFRYRQLFIYMCKHCFENEEVFKANMAEMLLDLAYDNISNVRFILAQFLCDLMKKEKYAFIKKNETVRKIIKILKNDKLQEIQNILKDINDVEDIDVELNKEVNHLFKDNMKFVSTEFGITRNVPLYSKFVEKVNKPETQIPLNNKDNNGETQNK